MTLPCPPELPKYETRDRISISELFDMTDEEQFFHLNNTYLIVGNRGGLYHGKTGIVKLMKIIQSRNKYYLAQAAAKTYRRIMLSQHPELPDEGAEPSVRPREDARLK